jgi:hypothetical protein
MMLVVQVLLVRQDNRRKCKMTVLIVITVVVLPLMLCQ